MVLHGSSDSFRDLIQGLYSYDWSAEAKVSVSMINLLGSLVSSNATFLIPTFQYLVKSLVPPVFALSNSTSSSSSGQQESRKQNMGRIHRCIKSLLTTVPTGQCELFPILASTFPHKRFDLHILESYVSELFSICEYFPGIEENILNLVISRCLEIDVEIVIEETGEAKIKDDAFESFEATENMFLLDDHDNAKLSGFRQFSSGVHKISDEVASMADKLDVLLICLLQYLFDQLSKNRKEITQYIFNALLNIFEANILATHRSKFVQYILFFVAGFTCNNDLNFYEPFAQRLLNIFLRPTFAPIKRQSAVLYLASFVSRANFLPLKFVV